MATEQNKPKASRKRASAKQKQSKSTAPASAGTATSAPQFNPAPRPGNTEAALAGTPGPGPKVGDSAFQSPIEDSLSKGRAATDSDGTTAGSLPARARHGKKAKDAKATGPKIGDAVVWVTEGRNPGKCRPALVMRPTDAGLANAGEKRIDLVAFPDSGKYPNNDHLGNVAHREGVPYSQNLEPNTWHYPKESAKLLEKKAESEATQIERDTEAANAARRRI